MNILVLLQSFETPADKGSDRYYFFCRKLKQKGHNVNIITSNIDYKKSKPKFSNKKQNNSVVIDGIQVDYLNVFTKIRGSFFRRSLFYISFFQKALIVLFKKKNVDLIYAVSTPLSTGFLGVIASKIHKAPLIFEVTDIWPDAAIHTGVLNNKLIIAALKIFEKVCYKNSTKIIALTNGIAKNIKEKINMQDKVITIPNGVDQKLFSKSISREKKESLRESYNFKSKFVCMYLGAHGRYNSLETIIEAANFLKDDSKYLFVFVGDGDEKIKLIEQTNNLNLKNIIFFDSMPRTAAIDFLNLSDMFLLPNRKGNFFEGNLPNKLFDFMISEKPIVVSGFGESANLINLAGCGIVVEAEDSANMAIKIRELAEISFEERISMGKRGASFVKEHYNREKHFASLMKLFLSTQPHKI